MAAGKEIRGKIKSVENTKKITKAMEMVAASKMRKAQQRMRAARPYSEKIRNIAANLGKANPEYVHPFMKDSASAKESGFHAYLKDKHAALMAKLEAAKAMDKDAEAEMSTAAAAFKKSFA